MSMIPTKPVMVKLTIAELYADGGAGLVRVTKEHRHRLRVSGH